ncbi:hypothetical protein OIU85_016478 [Salix viminalis]|uniref:Uncharacterized protein n=1 Tax=Salix viminalis TaxID=40686 RepID=A0A9Q0V5B9_SALVM|nr:hypothetical protein OIU85_016478 [Salix viminalis]
MSIARKKLTPIALVYARNTGIGDSITSKKQTISTPRTSTSEARHDHAFRPNSISIQDKRKNIQWKQRDSVMNIFRAKHVQAHKIVRKKTTIFSSHCPFGLIGKSQKLELDSGLSQRNCNDYLPVFLEDCPTTSQRQYRKG